MDLVTKTIKINSETGFSLYLTQDKAVKHTKIEKIIIHFHGLPGAPKEQFSDLHQLFVPEGFMVVSFNYPGLWDSPGLFVPKEIMSSSIAVVEFLKKHHPKAKYFIFAESFGGMISLATVLMLIKQDESYTNFFQSIAFRAPLPSVIGHDPQQFAMILQELNMQGILQTDKQKWLEDEEFISQMDVSHTLSELSKINELSDFSKIVHVGKNDEVLPYQGIVQTYQNYTELEVWADLPHNGISDDLWKLFISKIVAFYNK